MHASKPLPILPSLDILSRLHPPAGVLLVGAGSGTSAWVQHLMAAQWPNVTLVEADEATAQRLHTTTQHHPSWEVITQLVGPRSEPAAFYIASLQTESGLLAPECLRSLWPNLKTIQQHTRSAITLAQLQQRNEPRANWLLLDCLPALPLIQGSAEQLQHIDLIAARVLLSTSATQNEGSTATELEIALEGFGFRCLALEPSRHPAIAHVLFVRDNAALASQLQTQAQQLQQEKAQETKAKAEVQAQLQALQQEMAAIAQTKDQFQAQAQQLQQEKAEEVKAKAEAQTLLQSLQQEQAAQGQAKATAEKLAIERQQRIDTLETQAQHLQQEKAQETKAQAEVQAQLQALQQEMAAIAQTKDQLQAQAQQLQQEKAEEVKAKAEAQTLLQALQQEQAAQGQAKATAEKLAIERQQRINTLETQAQQLQQEKVQETKAKAEVQAQLQALQQEMAALAQTKDQLQAQAQQLQQDKEQAATQLQQSVAELDNNKKASADLQKQVDGSLNRLAKLQIAFQNLQATMHAQAQDQSQPAATANQAAEPFQPKLLAEFNLGEAWAGNTVNTVIFRHHGIFTHQGHQFTSFYVDEKTLRFVCRRLSDDHIIQHDLAGEYNPKDAHNSISMGVDRQGYLHVCFDHHATKLRYRRSLQPMSIDGWTDDLQMTGRHEDQVTYPTFILPRAGFPLTLLYRDGTHNKGSARLKYYNEKSQSWKDKSTSILSGAEQKPWTSNAYWNHPAIGTDGSLHLSFVWRTGVLGDEELVNNINIGYAWSPDNGHHWYTLQGQPYQVPITPTTAETIWPVPPGSNLINQCSMALDRFNRPHIVFYANDADGIPQYQHLRYDGKRWHHQTLNNRTQPFNLAGGGTLQIPISRPEVLIDHQDNVLVMFRGDLTGDRMAITRLCAPLYAATDAAHQMLSEQPLGFAEPLLDREGWRQSQKLTLLTQHNQQPDHDANPVTTSSAIGLCEFDL